MSIEYDNQAQAQAAMQLAASAICERERLEWVRIALVWHGLAPASAMPPRTETHVTSDETSCGLVRN